MRYKKRINSEGKIDNSVCKEFASNVKITRYPNCTTIQEILASSFHPVVLFLKLNNSEKTKLVFDIIPCLLDKII